MSAAEYFDAPGNRRDLEQAEIEAERHEIIKQILLLQAHLRGYLCKCRLHGNTGSKTVVKAPGNTPSALVKSIHVEHMPSMYEEMLCERWTHQTQNRAERFALNKQIMTASTFADSMLAYESWRNGEDNRQPHASLYEQFDANVNDRKCVCAMNISTRKHID